MHSQFLNKNSATFGIGKINILAIALMCTVLGGMLLVGTKTNEQTVSEMQQYLTNKQKLKSVNAKPHYNPFALASNDPVNSAKPSTKSWVVNDAEYEKKYIKGNILEGILSANANTFSTANSKLTPDYINRIFDKLEPVKVAIEMYFVKTQQWPNSLEEIGFENPSFEELTLSLSARGKLSAKLLANTEIIQLSPKSVHVPFQWFCQTTLNNYLLGRGNNRMCIHNSKLRNLQKDG